MVVALIIIGIVLLVVFFIIPCIISLLFFRNLKKHTEEIEKMNAEDAEKFERKVKEQHEAMEEFRRKNFPNY